MGDDSRAKQAAHSRPQPPIVRLGPADAQALHAYLAAKDVWPCPRVQDLAEFLGRNDAAVFATRDTVIRATASGVQDHMALHVQWVHADEAHADAAGALVDAVAAFGRARGAAVLYADAADGGPTEALLRAYGFVEDGREGDVVRGEPSLTVAFVKVLDP